MIDLPAHETTPEAVCSPQVITRNDTMVDPFYRYLFSWCHVDPPSNFRFWIFDFGLSEKESVNRLLYLLFILFSPNRKSAIENQNLFYDFLRPHEHHRGNRQAKCLGGL
jgi:hypothetical protein